jgi:hypothetical protein
LCRGFGSILDSRDRYIGREAKIGNFQDGLSVHEIVVAEEHFGLSNQSRRWLMNQGKKVKSKYFQNETKTPPKNVGLALFFVSHRFAKGRRGKNFGNC